jgi:hypothetical protein
MSDDHHHKVPPDPALRVKALETALETVVSKQTDIQPGILSDLKDRWEHAYRTTPHGEKVML